MKQSNLQFSNPHIEKIDFKVNTNNPISNEMPISIEIEVAKNPKENKAVVKLILCVGKQIDENAVTAIYFKGDILAEFTWEENISNPEKMLRISGGTVLLSYIRPILSNLTMQAGIKPLYLPFVNFTEE